MNQLRVNSASLNPSTGIPTHTWMTASVPWVLSGSNSGSNTWAQPLAIAVISSSVNPSTGIPIHTWKSVYNDNFSGPTSLSATNDSFCNVGTPVYQVTVSWTNSHSGRFGTKIYRDDAEVGQVDAGETSFIDTSVVDTLYVYHATHIATEIESLASNDDTVIIGNPC